jgi:hypothetical protein
MASTKTTVFMTGTVQWAKVLGAPRYNKFKDANEWSFEFELGTDGIKALLENGLKDRIKGKGFDLGKDGKHADREPFIQLRKPEKNNDGNANPPIRVYNGEDEEWDQNTLIGNGSLVDLKVDIRDYGVGKIKGIYPAAIRVKGLVPYVSSEFGGMDGDAPKPGKKKAGNEFAEDLNDDIPF